MFDIRVTPTSVYFNGEKMKRKYTNGSRKIFLNKEYVVKLEMKDDRTRFWQCKHEYNLWKRISKRYKSFFVPTLLYFHTDEYDYCVQPRINVKCYNKEETLIKQFSQIEYVVNKYGLSDLYEDLGCNWGISNGKTIIFDYGV